jgi:hypothetical protein
MMTFVMMATLLLGSPQRGVMAGNRTGVISGQVRLPSGAPAAGIRVAVMESPDLGIEDCGIPREVCGGRDSGDGLTESNNSNEGRPDSSKVGIGKGSVPRWASPVSSYRPSWPGGVARSAGVVVQALRRFEPLANPFAFGKAEVRVASDRGFLVMEL